MLLQYIYISDRAVVVPQITINNRFFWLVDMLYLALFLKTSPVDMNPLCCL